MTPPDSCSMFNMSAMGPTGTNQDWGRPNRIEGANTDAGPRTGGRKAPRPLVWRENETMDEKTMRKVVNRVIKFGDDIQRALQVPDDDPAHAAEMLAVKSKITEDELRMVLGKLADAVGQHRLFMAACATWTTERYERELRPVLDRIANDAGIGPLANEPEKDRAELDAADYNRAAWLPDTGDRVETDDGRKGVVVSRVPRGGGYTTGIFFRVQLDAEPDPEGVGNPEVTIRLHKLRPEWNPPDVTPWVPELGQRVVRIDDDTQRGVVDRFSRAHGQPIIIFDSGGSASVAAHDLRPETAEGNPPDDLVKIEVGDLVVAIEGGDAEVGSRVVVDKRHGQLTHMYEKSGRVDFGRTSDLFTYGHMRLETPEDGGDDAS